MKQWAAIAFRQNENIDPVFIEEFHSRHEAIEMAKTLKDISFTNSVWVARRKY